MSTVAATEQADVMCAFCKGRGVAFMPDPWGGVTGTCPDCFGTGLAADMNCPQCIENPCKCDAIYGTPTSPPQEAF